MGAAYWTMERLDHLRRVTYEGITGTAEMMEELAQDSQAVREQLIASRSQSEKYRLSTSLCLKVALRDDQAPTLYWFHTKNAGSSDNRFANWKFIPRGGKSRKPGYTKPTLKKYAASEEELELMWPIEQAAVPLREAMGRAQEVLNAIQRLEKSMRDAEFITEAEESTFERDQILVPLSNGVDVPVTPDEELCYGGKT